MKKIESVAIGCDHSAIELKAALMNFLDESGINYTDYGCFDTNAVDYPDIAKKVCEKVVDKTCQKGILICGTGIGMSIAANKIDGIRAALVSDYFSAKYTRLHNDSNVICFGARVIGQGLACELLDVFLKTDFQGGRHSLRVEKIMNLENE
ncbi:MAG: ribose 5-phosphate isomerase B [Oscillospiraceae bacterium]